MPRKYDKYMRPMPGFKANPERQKAVAEQFAQQKQKKADKHRERLFKVEPEELKVLEAIEKLPESIRADAAEGALIARVARRKRIIK